MKEQDAVKRATTNRQRGEGVKYLDSTTKR